MSHCGCFFMVLSFNCVNNNNVLYSEGQHAVTVIMSFLLNLSLQRGWLLWQIYCFYATEMKSEILRVWFKKFFYYLFPHIQSQSYILIYNICYLRLRFHTKCVSTIHYKTKHKPPEIYMKLNSASEADCEWYFIFIQTLHSYYMYSVYDKQST